MYVLLLLVGLLLIGAAYFIVEAPTLLAELLLESSIVGALYPALRSTPRRGWLPFLLRRTVLPMILVLVAFTLLGVVLHEYGPEATSIGGVFHHESARP